MATLEARLPSSSLPARRRRNDGRFLERAKSLINRYIGEGGVHVGFDVMKITFAFEAARFPHILDAAIRGGAETEGEEPLWGVGMAQGDIKSVLEDGFRSDGVGSALVGAADRRRVGAGAARAARRDPLRPDGARAAERRARHVGPPHRARRHASRSGRARRSASALEAERGREPAPNARAAPRHVTPAQRSAGAGRGRGRPRGPGERRHATPERDCRQAAEGARRLGGRLGVRTARRAPARAHAIDRRDDSSAPARARRTARRAPRRGDDASIELAAKIIAAFLWPKQSGAQSAIIIDDARSVDPATLEGCVRAMRSVPSLGMIARLDATSGLPSVLSSHRRIGRA